MPGLVAGSMLANLASNAMADAKAETAYDREQQLMRQQNLMNRHNALMAYSTQVQGAKLAGLSPAMLNGATPQVAAPVTKGSAPVAENVEYDPASLLMEKQAENIDAQTQKTKAETAKISGVDTENTIAETQARKAAAHLHEAQTVTEGGRPGLVAAQTANTEAETQRIKNINQVFSEENSAMGLFGQTTAQEWQKESWYAHLPKGVKMVIDDIARGELDLTVGIANALDRSIATDSKMNSVQTDKVQYALTRAVIEAQMKSPKVMKALSRTPEAQYNEVIARAAKLGAETRMLNFDLGYKEEQKEVWERNDPDKLYSEYQKDPTVENAAKWLVSSMRSTGVEVFKSVAPAGVLYQGARSAGEVISGRKVGRDEIVIPQKDIDNPLYRRTLQQSGYGQSEEGPYQLFRKKGK